MNFHPFIQLILGKAKEGTFKATKSNIKKVLIKQIGQCKQCQLCNKLFSTEYKACNHIHEQHLDIQYEDVKHLLGKSSKKQAN